MRLKTDLNSLYVDTRSDRNSIFATGVFFYLVHNVIILPSTFRCYVFI